MVPSAARERAELRLTAEERQWLCRLSSGWAERDEIPEEVYVWIVRRRWFKLFVPARFGGLEASLVEAVRLYEELAQGDGSVAWLVQIGAGGGFFLPAFAPEVAERLFSPEQAVVAGSGALGGRARRVPGGYRVTGQWHYASGAQYATLFTANAVVEETAAVRAFAFFPEQVRIERDWRAWGMRATSTWSFSVADAFVPEELSFVVGEMLWDPGLAVYRLPFGLFGVASIGAVVLGLARAWFEEAEGHARFATALRQELMRRRSLLEYARGVFQSAVEAAERAALGALELSSFHRLEWMMQEAVAFVRTLLVELLPFAGMAVVLEKNRLGRIARDFLVACQHQALWSARARWQ